MIERRYDRQTWIRLSVVLFLTPIIVVVFRIHLTAWGYYAAGALFIGSAVLMYCLDDIARTRLERAARAAEIARRAYDKAASDAPAASLSPES